MVDVSAGLCCGNRVKNAPFVAQSGELLRDELLTSCSDAPGAFVSVDTGDASYASPDRL
jgi:hypothetical protein